MWLLGAKTGSVIFQNGTCMADPKHRELFWLVGIFAFSKGPPKSTQTFQKLHRSIAHITQESNKRSQGGALKCQTLSFHHATYSSSNIKKKVPCLGRRFEGPLVHTLHLSDEGCWIVCAIHFLFATSKGFQIFQQQLVYLASQSSKVPSNEAFIRDMKDSLIGNTLNLNQWLKEAFCYDMNYSAWNNEKANLRELIAYIW